MLKTPRTHLPKGFPLPGNEESLKFQPIWKRAFEIHGKAHNFKAVISVIDSDGVTWHAGPREGLLSTDESDPTYCDCYERAYQEFEVTYSKLRGIFESERFRTDNTFALEISRSIRLEA